MGIFPQERLVTLSATVFSNKTVEDELNIY
jgi:hypothetical protein